jgi:hypothetical protein
VGEALTKVIKMYAPNYPTEQAHTPPLNQTNHNPTYIRLTVPLDCALCKLSVRSSAFSVQLS